jgi:predicted P-loop ATPase
METFNEKQVTLFSNFKDVVMQLNLEQIFGKITGDTLVAQTEAIRTALAKGDKETAEKVKRSLQAVTFAGHYEGGRLDANLREYNYTLVIDFDHVSKDKLCALIDKANADSHTVLSFTTSSNAGFKIVVHAAITDPTRPTDSLDLRAQKSYHRQFFKEASRYYEELLGISVDQSGKDISRLCFLSADPHAYLNLNAIPFEIDRNEEMEIGSDGPGNESEGNEGIQDEILSEEEGEEEIAEGAKHSKTKNNKTVKWSEQTERAMFKVVCNYAEKDGLEFKEGSRNEFMFAVACRLNEYGVSREIAYEMCCKEFSELTQKEILSTVKSGYSDKKVHGKKKLSKQHQNRLRQQVYLDKHYSIVYDVIICQALLVEKKGDSIEYLPIDDYQMNTIMGEMIDLDIDCNIRDIDLLIQSSYCEKYNPILEYFKKCPQWDGKDYIKELADTVDTTNQSFWREVFKRFLVGSVAGCLDKEKVNQIVPILTGPQGIGKTTFLMHLAPPELRRLTSSGIPAGQNKDDSIRLTNSMFIALDEFDNIRDRELSYLKDIITRPYIDVRLPYNHRSEHLKHIASFAGTSNFLEVLHDQTGSRRFHCFDVANIDLQYEINYPQLYAQMYHLYKSKMKYWFDTDDSVMIAKNNQKFEHQTAEYECVATYIRHFRENEIVTYATTVEIANWIREKNPSFMLNPSAKIKLGQALIKQDFKVQIGSRVRKYAVRLLEVNHVRFINNKHPESPYDVDFDYYAPEVFNLLPKDATYEEIVALYLDMESNKKNGKQ